MSATVEDALLVVHAPGDERGGAPWREAFEAAGWKGHVVAPDLPGHASAPAPVGGFHDPSDAAIVALRAMRAEGLERPVVVGVGANGWVVSVLALGGRASALVLVDGLGGPWLSPAESIQRGRDWLRAIAADAEAMAPPPASGLDPRLRHGVPSHGSRRFAEKAAAATTVPALIVESPASPASVGDREDLAARFAGGAVVVDVDDASPATVAAAVTAAVAGVSRPA